MELKMLDWIQTLHSPVGDHFFPFVSALGNGGLIWIALGGVLLFFPKTRKCGCMVLTALCVDVLLANVCLKPLVARIRPCDVQPAVKLLIARPTDYSFPSGHTAAAFATVAALYLGKSGWLWKAALPLAVCMAFSRMYLYVHYPTDILGGIAVGLLAGFIGAQLVKLVLQRKERYTHACSRDTGV